jgi:hypothetical protein
VAGLAFARHGVEGPEELAGADIEAADVAGGALGFAVGGPGAADDDVAEDGGGRGHAVAFVGVTVGDAGAEVDGAVVSEGAVGLAGEGVDGVEATALGAV